MSSYSFLNEIKRIKKYYANEVKKSITDEHAFELLVLQYFFYKEKEIKGINDNLDDHLTNGANDGGVDLIYFDEEDEVLSIIQCKKTALSTDELIDEIRKMHTTVNAFQKANTGPYNDKLKRILQNNLDRLSDNAQIEYHVYHTGILDQTIFERKLRSSSLEEIEEMIKVGDLPTINTQIASVQDTTSKVKEFKISIDKAGNYLEYESFDNYGILVNVSSKSITQMYNRFKDSGLFDMNIRKYIANKLVDNGIRKTLDEDRSNFWFYNNGIIIACEDFVGDGNKASLL